MATINAALTINSGDLTGDVLSLSTSTNLTEAGTATGLSQTTGLTRRTYSSAITAQTAILTASEFTADQGHKVYLKNLSTTAGDFVTVFVNAQEIGRLYAGDFLFIPWAADSGDDIDIKTSDANMSIEYMAFVQTFT